MRSWRTTCLEATKNQTPKNSRFTNPIFNDIDLTLPVDTGKTSSLFASLFLFKILQRYKKAIGSYASYWMVIAQRRLK